MKKELENILGNEVSPIDIDGKKATQEQWNKMVKGLKDFCKKEDILLDIDAEHAKYAKKLHLLFKKDDAIKVERYLHNKILGYC